MLKPIKNLRKEIIFQDPDTHRFYRRVVGAIGWPHEPKPGFMVVLGEQYQIDRGLNGRPLEVLAEREVESITALYQGCLEFRKELACDTWLADLNQLEAVRLFNRENRVSPDQTQVIRRVWLRAAPYSHGDGRLKVLFQMLGMVQSLERKLLSYGPDSRLPAFAIGLDPKDLEQPAAKFPPLAALGYAVAEMLLREPWSKQTSERKVITHWDPHTGG